jgi:hypothetical protein
MRRIKLFEDFITGDYDSSITIDQARSANVKLLESRKLVASNKSIKDKCLTRLDVFDPEVIEFIIEQIFSSDEDDLIDHIIKLGDRIMARYGTNPKILLDAITTCYDIIITTDEN